MNKRDIHRFQELAFDIIISISYILLIATSLGTFTTKANQYLETIYYYIKIYTCLFLMWRFNPLRSEYQFTHLDRKIVFYAGTLILTTTALNKYIVSYREKVKKFATSTLPKIKNEL